MSIQPPPRPVVVAVLLSCFIIGLATFNGCARVKDLEDKIDELDDRIELDVEIRSREVEAWKRERLRV